MTPALIASSSVRYSLTETLSLAARSVKKKLISMADARVRGRREGRGYTPAHAPGRRGSAARGLAFVPLQPAEELPIPQPRIARLEDPVVLVREPDQPGVHALGQQRVV